VTNTQDSGIGSLRDAVAESNRVAGADTITFDASFNSAKTITLTTISGNNARRIFNTIASPAAGAITPAMAPSSSTAAR
jgi:hypothetical protein